MQFTNPVDLYVFCLLFFLIFAFHRRSSAFIGGYNLFLRSL